MPPLFRAYDWHFLAPTFTHYFRMMLVHLGLPEWQAIFTPFGPTPWSKVSYVIIILVAAQLIFAFSSLQYIINLIAPHLLPVDGGQSSSSSSGPGLFSNEQFDVEDDEEEEGGILVGVPRGGGAGVGGSGAGGGGGRGEEFPLVTLDPSVFKARKSSRKSEDANNPS